MGIDIGKGQSQMAVSYTDNRIGSGHYCCCGHELTHSEYRDKHKKDHKCLNEESTK